MGLSGSHYESMLAMGFSLQQVLALAAEVESVREIEVADVHHAVGISPTVESPRGVVRPPPSPPRVEVT